MTTITPTAVPTASDTSASTSTQHRPLWKAAGLSGLAAAAATTVTVVAARAADIAVAVQGEQIPLLGFAQLTLIGALLGLVVAQVLSRRAAHPRRTFVRTTVALTALSIIPDVVVDATLGSKLVLALTHVVAASIVIPAIAARLAD
ncbi:MAG: DUF6069 family protein [Ilumatobacteraceae bacterium]